MITEDRLRDIEINLKSGFMPTFPTIIELVKTIREMQENIKKKPEIPSLLSRRDWFAGMAMEGVLSINDDMSQTAVVEYSIRIADAMLAELDKEGK